MNEESKLIKTKLGLLNLAEHLSNVSPACKVLNDRVLPFFEEQQIPLPRILTDRGREYNGKPEHH
jgi:hypothetical protein